MARNLETSFQDDMRSFLKGQIYRCDCGCNKTYLFSGEINEEGFTAQSLKDNNFLTVKIGELIGSVGAGALGARFVKITPEDLSESERLSYGQIIGEPSKINRDFAQRSPKCTEHSINYGTAPFRLAHGLPINGSTGGVDIGD